MNGSSTVLSGIFADRYAIERELGRGGTAIVFLARDGQRGHLVAIKVLRPELAQSVGSERFLKEIRVSQKLHHPHILPVLDSGMVDGHLFFVLPHMEGGTLRMRLERDRQLPLDVAIAITRSVADALEHAHAQGLVHRDVKPENILFTSGEACLADFGIARALERALDDTTTSTSVVRGTPPYMSPEQASGDQTLDGRSDIYSLACVFYELVAGIQPFVGPSPQSVIAMRLTHPPRPLRMYRPSVPLAMEDVMLRALAISPADRFQTASAFVDALVEAARTTDEVHAAERVMHRKRKWLAGSLAAAVIVIAIVAAAKAVMSPAQDSGAAAEGDPRRVAVLYLDALTPQTVPQYVVDGITEDLIDQMGAVRALHVISPNGVRRFRGGAITLDSIGRALRVGTIVSGTVARSGERLRVNIRLIEASTGRQLYSQALEEPWTDLFALQHKLAEQVAFFLRQQIGEEVALREVRRKTRSVAAWEAFQLASAELRRAMEAVSTRNTPEVTSLLLRADSLFARAEQLDPRWDLPTVRRGYIAMSLATQTLTPGAIVPSPTPRDSARYATMKPLERRERWLAHMVTFANEALRRAPGSAEGLAVRGEAWFRLASRSASAEDTLLQLAERDLNSALAIRPDFATAWSTLGQVQLGQGKFGAAATSTERAYQADSFFEVTRIVAAALSASLFAEQFDDARRWCRLGLTHYAKDVRFTQCELTILGWTGASRKDATRGWQLVAEIEARDTQQMLADSWVYRRIMVAAVLARAGMGDSARTVMNNLRAEERRDPTRRMAPIGEAYVRLLTGERDAAITALRAHLKDAPSARPLVARHPWFRPLADTPEFRALVQPTP